MLAGIGTYLLSVNADLSMMLTCHCAVDHGWRNGHAHM